MQDALVDDQKVLSVVNSSEDQVLEVQQPITPQNSSLQPPIKKKITKKPLTLTKSFPIDGKQQFGDKSICRICKKATMSLLKKVVKSQLNSQVVSCNRCHFKYHPECVNNDTNKEPQAQIGQKWHCLKCIDRVSKKKLKTDLTGQKKKKKKVLVKEDNTSVKKYFSLGNKYGQEEKKKKIQEFGQLYPQYIYENKIQFPILDEYLQAYQGLFGEINNQRKPTPIIDPVINQDQFRDILLIWNNYSKYAAIIKDIIERYEKDEEQERTFYHFKDTKSCYHNYTRHQIYNSIIEGKDSTILRNLLIFFMSFYLKQIFEDVETEQYNLKLANKSSYWQLMNYLWHCDREGYYKLIYSHLYELPQMLIQHNFFTEYEESQTIFQKLPKQEISSNDLLQTLIILGEGIIDLKKTSNIIQFRTEQILQNNKKKVQLSYDIRQIRSQIAESSESFRKSSSQHNQLKKQLEQPNLSRQDSQKFQKQFDKCINDMQCRKCEIDDLTEEQEQLKQEYCSLERDYNISQISSLMMSPSLFLGFDAKKSEYHFFLHESNKIFICYKDTVLDEDAEEKWGYYENQQQIDQLMKSLTNKGSRESMLKSNLDEIYKLKLLTFDESIIETEVNQIEEDQFYQEEQTKIDKYLLEIESQFSNFLATKQSRWIHPEGRQEFRKKLQLDGQSDQDKLIAVIGQMEQFMEHTMIQEKLELKSEEDMDIEKQGEGELRERKSKKVVEDDSSEAINEKENLLEIYEKMDMNKIRIRKLPLKLFGCQNDNLKTQMFELMKSIKEGEQIEKMIMVVMHTLNRVVVDYIARKKLYAEEKMYQQKVITTQNVSSQSSNNNNQQVSSTLQLVHQIGSEDKRISKNLRSRGKVVQKIEVDNEWEDQCKICRESGKVICCDSCPCVFHPKCLGLKQIPTGKWNCVNCLSKFEAQVKTRATLRKLNN